ncbi:MAG: single-stranded DNA-binding protein [Methylocystaceae bacterium]|nr:MAG: single-stranded DNA-binding protein [Methylocystaceae bacterium]
MAAHVLISGVLFRAPEQKISKAGKPFIVATIRAKDGEASQWWKLLCFSESAGAELMRLADGDAVSVQGALKVETYERDGAMKLSLTCIADSVLALRPAPKQRAKKDAAAPTTTRNRSRLDRHAGDGEDYFGDAVPF